MCKNKTRSEFTPIRNHYLKEHPFCERCGAPAEEVHHIRALIYGGTNEADNLSSLCRSCHKEFDVFEGQYLAIHGEKAPIEEAFDRFLLSPSMRIIAAACMTGEVEGIERVRNMLYDLHCAELIANGQPMTAG